MMRFAMPPLAWKWLVTILALCGALLVAIEVSHALQPMLDGQQGSLGVLVHDHLGTGRDGEGTHRLRIDSLAPGGPLQLAGARPGDRIKYDTVEDRWRKFAVGEQVGLTLYQAATERHLIVGAQAEPISFFDYYTYWGRCLLAIPALMFSLLIGFKQAASRAYRALAMTFIGLSLMFYFPFNYSPAGLSFTISKLGNITVYGLIWYWCVVFALNYQPYQQVGWRLLLTRALPWYRALVLACCAYSAWFALGHEAPMLSLANLLPVLAGLFITLASLLDGWRHCSGEIRQRHLWMLLSFACGSIPPMLILIPALDWTVRGMPLTIGLFFVGQLLMYIGLAYAVLRYRVFNFDFAVSRALVFSVVNLLILCSFGLIGWVYGSVMHGSGSGHGASKGSLVADAGLALLGFLVFNKVHGTIERRVERLIFRAWHDNEAKLRDYVRQAAHITTVDALLASLRIAVDRFTGQTGCAIYLRRPGGDYTLACGTLDRAPAAVAERDGVVDALRTLMGAVFFERVQSAVGGELALPMSHRGALNGFVVVGAKPRGVSYRPDECEVLGFAAHQIGLDLHALRVEELERALRELERKTELQGDELLLMSGRRKAVRRPAAADEIGASASSVDA